MVKIKKIDKKTKNKKIEGYLNPKEKLLKYMIENKGPHSIRNISGATLIDYKNTYNIINELYPETLSKRKMGNTNIIKLNLIPNQEIYLVEDKRTKKFLKENKEIKLVLDDIKSLNYPFFIVLLFGSRINKTYTLKSDIDICIISDNKEKTKELLSKLRLLPLPLEIHDFSVKEFESMLKTKELNIAHEIVKNNIILYGADNYYVLISKWMKNE